MVRRRVEPGRAPEDVRAEPEGVDPPAGGVVVDGEPEELVADDPEADAEHKQLVGDRPDPDAEHQLRKRDEEQQVHRRIGHLDAPRERLQRGVEVRADEEDPLHRAGGDRDDDRVEDGDARPDRPEVAEEQKDAGEEERVARQVERVDDRGRLWLAIQSHLVVARDRVRNDVAEQACGEEPPGQAAATEVLGAVQDRPNRRQPDQDVEHVLRVARQQEIDPDRDPPERDEGQGGVRRYCEAAPRVERLAYRSRRHLGLTASVAARGDVQVFRAVLRRSMLSPDTPKAIRKRQEGE